MTPGIETAPATATATQLPTPAIETPPATATTTQWIATSGTETPFAGATTTQTISKTDNKTTAGIATMVKTPPTTAGSDSSAAAELEAGSLRPQAGPGPDVVADDQGDVKKTAPDAEANGERIAARTRARRANDIDDRKYQPKRARAGYVSRQTRREVFTHDGEQCTYVDAEGNRCPSRAFLELDHVDPRARGRSDDAANLRVRCARHNKLYAEQVFGREYVARKIDLRRRKYGAAARRVIPETFSNAEMVARALRTMGFRAPEVRRAMAMLPSALDAGASPVETLLRQALLLLT